MPLPFTVHVSRGKEEEPINSCVYYSSKWEELIYNWELKREQERRTAYL